MSKEKTDEKNETPTILPDVPIRVTGSSRQEVKDKIDVLIQSAGNLILHGGFIVFHAFESEPSLRYSSLLTFSEE